MQGPGRPTARQPDGCAQSAVSHARPRPATPSHAQPAAKNPATCRLNAYVALIYEQAARTGARSKVKRDGDGGYPAEARELLAQMAQRAVVSPLNRNLRVTGRELRRLESTTGSRPRAVAGASREPGEGEAKRRLIGSRHPEAGTGGGRKIINGAAALVNGG